jgi:hypothetical protein
VAAAICLALALIYLGETGIIFGLAMGALVVVHLLLVKLVGSYSSPLLIKESGVAFIYCYGIWGLPLLETFDSWMPPTVALLAFLQFFLLALINLLEFSLFEHKIDEADGHTSFVRAIGPGWTRRLLFGLLALMLVATGWSWWEFSAQANPLQIIYLLMTAVLAAMLIFPRWFSQNERYRAWGDGAFLLPFLYPLLAWLI